MDIEVMVLGPWGVVLGLGLGLVVGGFPAWWLTAMGWKNRLFAFRQQAEQEKALATQYQQQQLEKLTERQLAEQALQNRLEMTTEKLGAAQRDLAQLQEQVRQQSSLQQTLKEQGEQIQKLHGQLKAEHGLVNELRARLESSQKETEEKIALLNGAKEQMKLEFQAIAQKLFEEKSEKFTQKNQANLGEILVPLKHQLADFKKKVEDVYDKESRDRVSLLQEIVSLKQLNTKMASEALNLTLALKGSNKAQGNWGEMVLEKVLDASGLQKGREYETQGSYVNEHGSRLKPDVVVHLPDNKQVVIDSKVSLIAWERFCCAADSEQPDFLRNHIDSIRTHIKELSVKQYHQLYEINSPDYVLMFIPIEPAFLKALEADSELFNFGFEKNIILVCPSTLLVTLKTIHNIWRYEYQNRNVQEIARQAGSLHDQFVLFVESLDDIGDKLVKAQDAYDTARKRLVSGKGNLVRRVIRLEKLGANTKKVLPGSVMEALEDLD